MVQFFLYNNILIFASQFLFGKMSGLSKYCIDIVSLKNQEYQFEFIVEPSFFQRFEESEIEKCSFDCLIVLRKTDGFIEANFKIQGFVELECDRSLDKFDHSIDLEKRMIFKFGEEDREIDDEVEMISKDRQSIDMSKFFFEFISMAIPMKRLHPRYMNEEQTNEELYFSSEEKFDLDDQKEEIDPRWEALKKLRDN
jgi:uncharacterized metal-binding protein YceD (DUF177 family)